MISFPTTRLARVRAATVGFRPRRLYQVLAGFHPNGSTDLHYYVVNESGEPVALRSQDILLADPRERDYDAGQVAPQTLRMCRIKERNGQMPVGFRERRLYQVVELFHPNGSTDLHLYVVNQSGVTVGLRYDEVILADPREQGYPRVAGSTGTASGAGLTFDFPASRTWHAVYNLARLVNVMTVDTARRVIVPHHVAFDVGFNEVTVYWSFPTAGSMILA